MARSKDDKQPIEGNSPDTRPMIDMGAQAFVDTSVNAENDPRGDNKPGVYADLPLEADKDPVTNLYKEQVDPVTGLPKAVDISPTEPLNPPVQPKAAPAGKAGGRKVTMVAQRDYWPRTRPDDVPSDQDYRVRAGEEFDVPQAEAEDLMESGVAVRKR